MVTIQNNNPLAGIKCAVALGNFDGVHKGHATLIRKTVALSHEYGLSSCVYTFSEHPSNFKNGFYGIITDNSEVTGNTVAECLFERHFLIAVI